MLFQRNRNGSHGVNHSGCIRGPGRSIIVPSDDWCMVGRRIPSARIQTSPRSTKRRPRSDHALRLVLGLDRHFSKRAGESSTSSTRL